MFRIIFLSLVSVLSVAALANEASAKQWGPRIVVRSNGRVEVGPVKVDTVPPSARVIERVIKGEPVDKAIGDEVKSRVDDAKTLASAPQIQTEVENSFFDQLRDVIGNDAVDVIEVLHLPEQISRAAPAAIVELLSGPKNLDDTLKELAGQPLLTLLIQARDYYKDKAAPIPSNVKILLLKTFPPGVIKRARYVVDDFGGNVPAIINKFQETFNGQHAVTVDNIIVFSSMPADDNIFFWAHEMQHTVQYAKLGMAGFAGEYTTNYKGLEAEANRVGEEAEKNAEAIRAFMKDMGQVQAEK
ncbi:hypothetical protein ACWGTI_19350 [Mesorhizobium sp. ArgA1]